MVGELKPLFFFEVLRELCTFSNSRPTSSIGTRLRQTGPQTMALRTAPA